MDAGRAADALGVTVGAGPAESGRGTTIWRIERWDEDAAAWVRRRTGLAEPLGHHFHTLRVRPYAVSEVHGNLITNAGWTRLMTLLTGGSGQALDATHTRIGVGNGTAAESYTDTDLAGTNKWFQPVSAAGTLGTRTLTFTATFGASDGNFAWNEFGIDVTSGTASAGATVGAVLFNRKAGIDQGTKAGGQTWTATATITWT